MLKPAIAIALLGPMAVATLARADDGPPDCYARQADTCVDVGPHAVPSTPDELVALRDKIANEPIGGATVAVLSLMAWHADPKVGEPLLVLSVSERNLGKGKGAGSHKGYVLSTPLRSLLQMFERSRDCARSYAVGATPDNRYTMDPAAVTLRFFDRPPTPHDPPSPTTRKVFVCSSGADTCRPITMRINRRGIWKADEMSSLFVGCKPMAPLPSEGGPEDDL